MCKIIAGQDENDYRLQTRSFRLHGHVTSVRLEGYFWEILELIVRREKLPGLSPLLNQLHDEILEMRGQPPSNFSSLLRTGCVKYINHHQARLPS